MKQVIIISGKGGTGKTVMAAALAVMAHEKIIVDCDVDAANLELLLNTELQENFPFIGAPKAIIDQSLCINCGLCIDLCRFGAIDIDDQTYINTYSCEGCGLCQNSCPVQAISMPESPCGQYFISKSPYGPLVHARLGIVAENSGKLVTIVRRTAIEMAGNLNKKLIIIDGPPGTGCPVMSSISGVDLAVLVTEPTCSGFHDFDRILSVANHFQVKTMVVINKFDLNLKQSKTIEEYCRQNNLEVIGKIPFDPAIVDSVVNARPPVCGPESPAKKEFENICQRLIYQLEQ